MSLSPGEIEKGGEQAGSSPTTQAFVTPQDIRREEPQQGQKPMDEKRDVIDRDPAVHAELPAYRSTLGAWQGFHWLEPRW